MRNSSMRCNGARRWNAAVADIVHNLPLFPYVRESLGLLQNSADAVVVSATPTEALVSEYE